MLWNRRYIAPIAAACLLVGCQGIRPGETPDPQSPPKHIDVAYTQFILPPGGDNKTPVDISRLPIVVKECGGKPPEGAKAGGAEILVTLATSLLGKLAAGVVEDLQRWVGIEIAKYSTSRTGAAVRVPFYSPALWYGKPGSDDRYSCFAIAVAECDQPDGSESASASCTDPKDTRAVIVGQFRRTTEFMQVRPLAAFVHGFDPKRSAGRASLAASLKLTSVWWDGHAGHIEKFPEIKVLSGTFLPAGDGTVDLAVLVPGERAGAPGTTPPPVPVSWDKQPLLARPPLSPNSEGTLEITATVAEANAPPGDLKFLSKVLSDQSADISAALKSALTELLPAPPAKKK